MSDNHLAIDVQADPETHTLTLVLRGEVDAHSAPGLDGEIQAGLFTAGASTLVIDFSDVTFLDSSGLRVVIAAHRSMREREGTLIVRRPSDTVQRLLEITQLTGELQIEH
jgi:anti-anti-sigma factor